MKRILAKYSILLAGFSLYCLMTGGEVYGGLVYDGRLGVDFEFHDYTGKSDDLTKPTWVKRASSYHFLDFMLRGPIVNENFATFSTRSKFYGAYFQARKPDSLSNSYINPDLHGFYGQLSLFPNRSYPLQMFYSKNQEDLLKHEARNQMIEGSHQPALRVVRRYHSESSALGANMRVQTSERLIIEADVSTKKNLDKRVYEFGEDKDLFLLAQPIGPQIVLPDTTTFGLDRDASWSISIAVINNDTSTGATVYLDMDPVYFIDPLDGIKSLHVSHLSDSTSGSGIISFVLDYQMGQYNDQDSDNRNDWTEFIEDFTKSLHTVTLVPDSLFNSTVSLIYLRGNMQWIITEVDPGTPLDQDQEGDDFTMTATYDTKNGFRSSAKISSASRNDLFQELEGKDLSISNDLAYDLNPQTTIAMRTTNLTGSTFLVHGRGQNNSSFSNLTDATYATYGGKTVSLSHAFNLMESDDGVTVASNLANSFRGRYSTPTGYKDHIVEGSLIFSNNSTEQTSAFDTTIEESGIFRDTSMLRMIETSSNTFAAQVKNKLSFNGYGMTLKPDHVFKYQVQSQTASSTVLRVESNSTLASEVYDHSLFGSANFMLQHYYLKTTDDRGFNSTSKITTDFSMAKSLHNNFSIRLGAGYVKSTYAIESKIMQDNEEITIKPEKPSDSQTSYQFGSKLNLLDFTFISSSYRVTAQETSTTANLSVNVRMILPLLNANLISDIKNENRELVGQPTQIRFYFDNSLSFNVRRIIMNIEYSYAKETRYGETHVYSLWSGKLTRAF